MLNMKTSCIRAWLNGNAMFHETFVSMSVKQNLFVSVFVHKCLMMLNDVEYTTFKMFVTQMSNYLFVISFQLMFYKTLRYRLARALRRISCHGRNHSQASCEYSLTIFLCCQHQSEYSLLGSKFSTNLLFTASKYHVTIQQRGSSRCSKWPNRMGSLQC